MSAGFKLMFVLAGIASVVGLAYRFRSKWSKDSPHTIEIGGETFILSDAGDAGGDGAGGDGGGDGGGGGGGD